MIVAEPVLERLDGRRLTVAGGGRDAAYAEVDGFVVALTARGVPLMPNGVGLAGSVPAAGERVTVVADETWDPTLRLGGDPARRGAEILGVLGAAGDAATPDDDEAVLGPAGDEARDDLVRAVAERDPGLAAAAAERLIGRGPGLTPEGDDVLAAAAAVVAAGPWPAAAKAAWLAPLVPPDLRERTTALSATLLELAAAAKVVEPLHGLFGPDWRPALARLVRLGHSTGRAYAAAAAAAASRLRHP